MAESIVKALSLYQPWASLMSMSKKKFETRTWGTSFRGLVVIHASKTLEVDWHNAPIYQSLARGRY